MKKTILLYGLLGGILVAGLNPYRPFDAEYRGFLDLLSGQIAAGLVDGWDLARTPDHQIEGACGGAGGSGADSRLRPTTDCRRAIRAQ